MPRKKRYAKRRRRYKRKPRSAAIAYGTSPLPTRFKTHLRYCEGITLNAGAAGVNVGVFRANGLFDPNADVGGHQPRGWDELIPMFQHATVIGSKITAQFLNEDSANAQTVGIALRGSTNKAITVNDYVEGGHVRYKMLGSNESGARTITMGYSPKFLGITDPLDNSNHRNTDAADATEQAVFHVFAGGPTGIDVGAVQCMVSIEYICVFQEPKPPVQS